MTNNKNRFVKCPVCRAEVEWVPESLYRPFCSERCRTVDLGGWAAGSYSFPETGVLAENGHFTDWEKV